ncbi:MAG TPA: PAS domain S-box protein [Syntrophorhabdaceae bacterium]|nr:PAS domain S-box protein [Syntrophorhabdaceae bacterium]
MRITKEPVKKSRTGGERGIAGEVKALMKTAARLQNALKRFRTVEKALEDSEAKYRLLVKHSSDGVLLFDPHTLEILEANTSFLLMTGYEEKEITSFRLTDIILMSKKEIIANAKKVLQKKELVFGLRKYRKKDGTLIDVEITSSLINHNNAKFIMVNVRDVSDRLRSQHKLEKQADILREQAEIIDIAEDAIIVQDMKGRITFWNNGARGRYGFTSEEALGKNVSRLLRTKFPEKVENIRKKILFKGKWDGEITQKTKSGRELVVFSKWKLRRDEKGRPVAILEINNDITERKRAERSLEESKKELESRVALRTSELMNANSRLVFELKRRKQVEDLLRRAAERYKDLFDNSPIGIYRIDQDGRILMANPALIRMMGYASYDEFSSVRSFKKSCEPTYLGKKIKDRLEKEGRIRGFEARWKLPDGSVIYVSENARAIKDDDGKTLYYEGTVEDISERRQTQERIDQYQRQLRSLASELSLAEERERRRIATLLHDHIGQMLAVSKIKLGSIQDVLKDNGLADEIKEIRDHVGQAIKITRSLTFELSPPILYDLGLEAALEWLTEQLEEQSSIRREFESDGVYKPISDGMRVLLFTAVRELLVNVTKHSGASQVKVTVRRPDGNISIHVADNGSGFNASKRSYHIAEARGFGLFSIRERLHSLGGHMDVRSGVGRGTRIILIAPLEHEEVE